MEHSSRAFLGWGLLTSLAWGTGILGSVACSATNSGQPSSDEAGPHNARAAGDGGAGTAQDATGATGATAESGTAGDATETGRDSGIARDASGGVGEGAATLDAGAPDASSSACVSDGGTCSGRRPGTVTIIGSTYSAQGSTITYGTAPDLWDVYAFADPGQTVPSLTPSAGALSISATLTRPAAGQSSAGFGVSIRGPECVDESNYARGLVFTISGDLGNCSLYVDAVTSQDETSASDPCRGTCTTDAGACVAPSVQITSSGMITLPNMAFIGGSPTYPPDTSKLMGFRWRLQTPGAAAGLTCTANITIGSVMLLGL